MSPGAGGGRLSLNQMTVPGWTVQQAVDGCARHGIRHIGLWREKVAERGVAASARAARDAGVAVSSLCRGGFFPAGTAAGHPPDRVGVLVDAYHVWWDPAVDAEIARCGRRVFGFHISDWIVPLPDVLYGRGMMGDGVIELRRLRQAVDGAGFTGPIEVEIFNRAINAMSGDEVLSLMKERYLAHVA